MNDKMRLIVAIILAAMFLGSCKKDSPAAEKTPVGEKAKAEIITALNGKDSISTFVSKLKDLEITDAEAAAGLTVFAPINQAFTTALTAQTHLPPGGHGLLMASPMSEQTLAKSVTLADSSDVKDYIIKGVIRSSDLVNGKQLTALSGESLTITILDGKLRLNGVLVSGPDLSVSSDLIVNTLSGLLKKKPTITIIVWDASQWSSSNPKGVLAEGATVSLYKSQKDYADGTAPAYIAKTQADGLAKFKQVIAGTYYITATKGEMSNIFKQPSFWNNSLVGGLYTGYSFDDVFQTQEEITAAPQINAALGNPKYIDINGDGRVDQNDFVTLPAQSINAYQGTNVSTDMLISYSNNFWRTLKSTTEANTILDNVYQLVNFEFLNNVMLDAIMSDDVDNQQGQYMAIDRFNFNPSDNNFTQRWKIAYQSILPMLDKIIRDVPGLTSTSENETIVAQAKALRAYTYLNLLTYYENVPLIQGVLIPYDVTNSHKSDVSALITSDLESAAPDLPNSWPADQFRRINRNATYGLQARLYLYLKDYGHAQEMSQKVINSGLYQLLDKEADVFITVTNKEAIWNTSDLSAHADFDHFFTKGIYCPVIRLTEIYLIAAECTLETGNTTTAIQYVNILNTRRKDALLATNASLTQIRAALRSTWQKEMNLEGNRFTCLTRWGIANQVLGAQGFQAPKNNLWPIPLDFIQNYPMLLQNAGY